MTRSFLKDFNQTFADEGLAGKVAAAAVLSLIVAVSVVVLVVYYGVSVMLLWSWFVVPLGMPEITLLHAIGIGILLGLCTKNLSEPNGEENWKGLLMRPGMAVGFGWIVHWMMTA